MSGAAARTGDLEKYKRKKTKTKVKLGGLFRMTQINKKNNVTGKNR